MRWSWGHICSGRLRFFIVDLSKLLVKRLVATVFLDKVVDKFLCFFVYLDSRHDLAEHLAHLFSRRVVLSGQIYIILVIRKSYVLHNPKTCWTTDFRFVNLLLVLPAYRIELVSNCVTQTSLLLLRLFSRRLSCQVQVDGLTCQRTLLLARYVRVAHVCRLCSQTTVVARISQVLNVACAFLVVLGHDLLGDDLIEFLSFVRESEIESSIRLLKR